MYYIVFDDTKYKALTTGVSKIYRAILVHENIHNLHCFVFPRIPEEVLMDFRMTLLTFGVSALSSTANMGVKQNNVIANKHVYPEAASVVYTALYADDRLYNGGRFHIKCHKFAEGFTEGIR